ncbi:shikimate kinase [Acidicapsa dinghuensis]|uniref:Shikimate kinase n=1 Tax=Acidicapsa dinghuensis TaxID=2218256 RepID=A0ABW1EGX7_9BACT|nr:shikimate kinase [Acidicapsa dinghuensis]
MLTEESSLSPKTAEDVEIQAERRLPVRIVLTGFMGAGKTTVGSLLAKRLGYRFIDADVEIERETGATIAHLFEEHGEPWFRELEHETIQRLLEPEAVILALGGGAIEDDRTRRLLLERNAAKLVHLEASIETVLRRCRGTESVRPVLRDTANLEARYHKRLPLYRLAHLNVPVDSHTPAGVVEIIVERLSGQNPSR